MRNCVPLTCETDATFQIELEGIGFQVVPIAGEFEYDDIPPLHVGQGRQAHPRHSDRWDGERAQFDAREGHIPRRRGAVDELVHEQELARHHFVLHRASGHEE
jgi:hypothetical protein